MFSRFMNVVKINKIIAKQRKLAKSHPDTGYSAIISALLENEAKGTFKHYSEYMRKNVDAFYNECIEEMKKSDLFIEAMRNAGHTETNDFTVVITAVSMQAFMCNDLKDEEIRSLANDNDNLVKVLVNMKLLPERFLDINAKITYVA
jgi:hypothetical protein